MVVEERGEEAKDFSKDPTHLRNWRLEYKRRPISLHSLAMHFSKAFKNSLNMLAGLQTQQGL